LVVPSTSGAARGAWDIEPWRGLARATAALGPPGVMQTGPYGDPNAPH
jgi:hypothetical protein